MPISGIMVSNCCERTRLELFDQMDQFARERDEANRRKDDAVLRAEVAERGFAASRSDIVKWRADYQRLQKKNAELQELNETWLADARALKHHVDAEEDKCVAASLLKLRINVLEAQVSTYERLINGRCTLCQHQRTSGTKCRTRQIDHEDGSFYSYFCPDFKIHHKLWEVASKDETQDI